MKPRIYKDGKFWKLTYSSYTLLLDMFKAREKEKGWLKRDYQFTNICISWYDAMSRLDWLYKNDKVIK